MKSASRVIAVAVAAAAAVSPAAAPAAPIRDPEQVVVTNDIQNPVVSKIVEMPAVTGTVGIDPVKNVVRVSNPPAPPEPFQVRVTVPDTGDATISCVDIPAVPLGKTLKITNVAMQATGASVSVADQFYGAIRQRSGNALPMFSHPIELSGTGITRLGHIATALYTGPITAPDDATFVASVCLLNIDPIGTSKFEALVTGEVL